MKKHNKRQQSKSNPTKSNVNALNDTHIDPDIELIAKDLDTLARQRLPDGVFQGELTGYEAEIRQDSILLALSWYLRGISDEEYRDRYPWVPARALAQALKIHKRDRLKELEKSCKTTNGIPTVDEPTSLHPAMLRTCDWSASAVEQVVTVAIVTALRSGQISLVNALIAFDVFVSGVGANEIAKKLRMTRGNVYQHLQRTKKITAQIIDQIEVPLIDPM